MQLNLFQKYNNYKIKISTKTIILSNNHNKYQVWKKGKGELFKEGERVFASQEKKDEGYKSKGLLFIKFRQRKKSYIYKRKIKRATTTQNKKKDGIKKISICPA